MEMEVSEKEILDYIKTRDLFEKELKEMFGISKKKVQKIREAIKMELLRKKD